VSPIKELPSDSLHQCITHQKKAAMLTQHCASVSQMDTEISLQPAKAMMLAVIY